MSNKVSALTVDDNGIHRDCIMFRGNNGVKAECAALISPYCLTVWRHGCGFRKTRAESDAQLARCAERHKELGIKSKVRGRYNQESTVQ